MKKSKLALILGLTYFGGVATASVFHVSTGDTPHQEQQFPQKQTGIQHCEDSELVLPNGFLEKPTVQPKCFVVNKENGSITFYNLNSGTE